MTRTELEEKLRQLGLLEHQLRDAMPLIAQCNKKEERAKDVVNRFEVINHLSDGSGREVVVWKGKPFEVTYSIQDNGRTLKVFLTDIPLKAEQRTKLDNTAKEYEVRNHEYPYR